MELQTHGAREKISLVSGAGFIRRAWLVDDICRASEPSGQPNRGDCSVAHGDRSRS